MINGVLNVWKEAGFTSHDVVAKLRGILHQKKIGHTGTLDPDATGVLPVCLGKGTRLCDMLTDETKTYEALLHLGIATDTQDMSGTVTAEAPVTVTEEEVRDCIASFVGEQQQVPPMYSALKVNGKKLYELAREGIEIERKARTVHFYEISILEVKLPLVRMEVTCSKGTYIRTLCHDIGQALGCGGAMYSLRRTMAAGYTLAEAVSLEDVQAQGEALLRPVESMFTAYPLYTLPSPGKETRVRNGNPITVPELADGAYRVHGKNGEFLCLSCAENGTLTSIKNFFGA
mgnify:CR=1 FL=1